MVLISCASCEVSHIEDFDSINNSDMSNSSLPSDSTPDLPILEDLLPPIYLHRYPEYNINPDTAEEEYTPSFDDLPSVLEHETIIPEPPSEANASTEPEIDVSSESIEDLSANYFATPDDTLSQIKLYTKLKQMYLSAEWDGFPFTIGEHTFSISFKGYINVDGSLIGGIAEPLDLPNESRYYNGLGLIDDCNIYYIPGKGSYILIDDNYMLYLRGENIPLEGGPLNWKELDGVDVNYGHALLYYVSSIDKLFLVTPMLDNNETHIRPYLFIFPDYNVSKIELIGQFKSLIMAEEGFRYEDEYGNWWQYFETDDGNYYFESLVNS